MCVDKWLLQVSVMCQAVTGSIPTQEMAIDKQLIFVVWWKTRGYNKILQYVSRLIEKLHTIQKCFGPFGDEEKKSKWSLSRRE